MSSCVGQAVELGAERARPSATCSGSAAAQVEHADACRAAPVIGAVYASKVGLMPCGLGLGQQALVLGVVDRLGLVDQHDGMSSWMRVAALEARVVERVLVLEVEQRALVLGAGEDLEQLGVEGHGSVSFGSGGR